MKKPEKIIKWLHIDRTKHDPFVDHNGKPLFTYSIEIPYWICRAFKSGYAKVEIREKPLSYSDMRKEENEEACDYFKANWSNKLTKMRKMNHNYLLVSTKAVDRSWFKTIEAYENFHRELHELNMKYGLSLNQNIPGMQK